VETINSPNVNRIQRWRIGDSETGEGKD